MSVRAENLVLFGYKLDGLNATRLRRSNFWANSGRVALIALGFTVSTKSKTVEVSERQRDVLASAWVEDLSYGGYPVLKRAVMSVTPMLSSLMTTRLKTAVCCLPASTNLNAFCSHLNGKRAIHQRYWCNQAAEWNAAAWRWSAQLVLCHEKTPGHHTG